jgi:TPR repeat protein
MYARVGRLLLTGEHPKIFDESLAELTKFEQAYFYLHTAAALNHKGGRFYLAIFLENGLLPTPDAVKYALSKKFSFLQ